MYQQSHGGSLIDGKIKFYRSKFTYRAWLSFVISCCLRISLLNAAQKCKLPFVPLLLSVALSGLVRTGITTFIL